MDSRIPWTSNINLSDPATSPMDESREYPAINFDFQHADPVTSNMDESQEYLDFQDDESIIFLLSTDETVVALDDSTLISDTPSSSFEFNDGITLMSTMDLEKHLSMLKLKMDSLDSTESTLMYDIDGPFSSCRIIDYMH